MDVLDRINAASPARATVELVLDSALDDEWTALKATLPAAAQKDAAAGDTGRTQTTAVIDRMEEIRDQVEASRVFFVFERVDWRERIALQVEHPPRDGNLLDASRGFNIDTYTPAIIRKACVGARDSEPAEGDDVELTPVPDASWDKLLGSADSPGSLNFGQVNRLYQAATNVNEGLSQVPRSARFLLEIQDSEASSTQPSPGTSPRSGSKAGSRRTSTRSRTTKKAASPA